MRRNRWLTALLVAVFLNSGLLSACAGGVTPGPVPDATPGSDQKPAAHDFPSVLVWDGGEYVPQRDARLLFVDPNKDTVTRQKLHQGWQLDSGRPQIEHRGAYAVTVWTKDATNADVSSLALIDETGQIVSMSPSPPDTYMVGSLDDDTLLMAKMDGTASMHLSLLRMPSDPYGAVESQPWLALPGGSVMGTWTAQSLHRLLLATMSIHGLQLRLLDTETGDKVAELDVPIHSPNDAFQMIAALSPDEQTIYVINPASQYIAAFSTRTGERLREATWSQQDLASGRSQGWLARLLHPKAEAKMMTGPQSAAVSPDGRRLYVSDLDAMPGNKYILAFDTDTLGLVARSGRGGTSQRRIDLGRNGLDVLRLSPDSRWLYALTMSRHILVVLDAESLDVVTDVNLKGGNAAGFTWLPPTTELSPRPVQPDLPPMAECTPVPVEELPAPLPGQVEGQRYVIDATASCVSYTVQEKFLNKPLPNAAVGITSAIAGELVMSPDGDLQPSVIHVAVRTFASDAAQRDNVVRNYLSAADAFPVAELHISGWEDAPGAWHDGQEYSLHLLGKLVIRGVEQPVVFDTTARLEGERLTLTAVTIVNQTDFDMQPPNMLDFVKVDDPVQIFVKLAAHKQ